MDLFDIFDVFGDLTGCCLVSLALFMLLLACAACVVGLSLIGAF
jgi:hypothetical protein